MPIKNPLGILVEHNLVAKVFQEMPKIESSETLEVSFDGQGKNPFGRERVPTGGTESEPH